MNQEELNRILDAHKKWLNNEEGGVRADLAGADLDFSSWPLFCGSLSVKVDTRIRKQLAYHLLSVIGEDMEEFISDPIAFANGFHRVDECGEIKR